MCRSWRRLLFWRTRSLQWQLRRISWAGFSGRRNRKWFAIANDPRHRHLRDRLRCDRSGRNNGRTIAAPKLPQRTIDRQNKSGDRGPPNGQVIGGDAKDRDQALNSITEKRAGDHDQGIAIVDAGLPREKSRHAIDLGPKIGPKNKSFVFNFREALFHEILYKIFCIGTTIKEFFLVNFLAIVIWIGLSDNSNHYLFQFECLLCS